MNNDQHEKINDSTHLIFDGNNIGLVVAEIELKNEDEEFSSPDWVLKEVSDDARYYNSNLISNPFNTWQ